MHNNTNKQIVVENPNLLHKFNSPKDSGSLWVGNQEERQG
jgi:hypothetical protein